MTLRSAIITVLTSGSLTRWQVGAVVAAAFGFMWVIRRFVLWVEDVNAQTPARVVAGQFYRPGVTPVDRVALAETWGQRGRP